ncbi:zf-HC2 domain-containing protein [Amycolatopsis nigrescens]|uniref:zf-HC2 domain-containing protein n=1 Tax=Amycolatopsis nigrescens TaxID=381445 RepID=UPI00037D1F37|nr:zf-HC2 domain-containing protein [Amycolatopsis nigrescens]
MTESTHVDVAAYILGALNERDTEAFQAHLLNCSICQLELLELHELPELLDEVRRAWPEPPSPRLPAGRPEETTGTRRRRRSRLVLAGTALLAAAATVLTVALLSPTSTRAGTPRAAPASGAPAQVRTGTAPGLEGSAALLGAEPTNTVDAKVTVRPKEWGAQAELELRGVTGPLRCRLIAVPWTGEAQVMTGWSVPAKGYGVPGSPEPLRVSGGTALGPAEIEYFEIRADDGSLLVTVPN